MDKRYKNLNDKFTEKSEELRKSQSDPKLAERRVKEFKDKLYNSTKKVSELEGMNTRMQLIKEQVNNGFDLGKVSDKNRTPENKKSKAPSKNKCKIENTAKCPRGRDCKDHHPNKTCQNYSKMGTCPLEKCVDISILIQYVMIGRIMQVATTVVIYFGSGIR